MQPVCFADAREAIEGVRAAASEGAGFGIGVLDFQMPDMDGLELAKTLKAMPEGALLPLVLLTSVTWRGLAGEAGQSGFAAYLSKPVKTSSLRECLASVLNLPVTGQPERIITRHTLDEERASQRARILLAEDNLVNQKVALKQLEKLGYRIDVVENGLEAVRAVQGVAYDAVLMDCQMPEMDGFEATRRIRQWEDGTGRRLPIIALTASAMAGDAERCAEAGMDGYLSKPVQSSELRKTLEGILTGAATLS